MFYKDVLLTFKTWALPRGPGDEPFGQVALKRYIDDVAVEVIENELVAKLADIFSPTLVWNMSDEMVGLIAGESEDQKFYRGKLERLSKMLKKGLDTCQEFVDSRLLGETSVELPNPSPRPRETLGSSRQTDGCLSGQN